MAKTQRIDASVLRVLAVRLELERSSLLCVQLAHALGYQVTSDQPGSVQLEKSGSRPARVFSSIDALIHHLVRDVHRRIGR